MLSLAERFGQAPQDVLEWDASVLRMLRIEALGKPPEEVPDGYE